MNGLRIKGIVSKLWVDGADLVFKIGEQFFLFFLKPRRQCINLYIDVEEPKMVSRDRKSCRYAIKRFSSPAFIFSSLCQ